MIDNADAMPRIPLGVVIDAAMDPAAGISVGKKYRSGSQLALADERFALQVAAVTCADIAATLGAHPHWCGVLLSDELRRSTFGAGTWGATGTGWAAALNSDDALLPLEFVDHLRDEQASESFVARVLTCHAWRELQAAGVTLAGLQAFFAQHKYLLMSRHIGSYQQIGRSLADSTPATLTTEALDSLARQTITTIMAALRRPTTRGGHANTLAHIRGYLKKRLSGAEKAALDEALEWYRLGLVPLRTPLDLLREYFERYPDTYIDRQLYMQPRLHARFDLQVLLGQLRGTDGPRRSADER
jgi:uncharacterized protein YbgA (DUF1722 family)